MATVTKRKRKAPEAAAVTGALALARQVSKLPDTKLWLDYDREADVLYISLRRPQDATDTVDLVGKGITDKGLRHIASMPRKVAGTPPVCVSRSVIRPRIPPSFSTRIIAKTSSLDIHSIPPNSRAC